MITQPLLLPIQSEEAMPNYAGRIEWCRTCIAALYSLGLLRCAAHTARLAPRNDGIK